MTEQNFELRAEVLKVDAALGLVMGYAIVCEEHGKPYFDLQGDHIPEESMLKAALDFMENSQTAKEMHSGEQAGTIVFAWPMTKDIAKAFGISTDKTGLMIAMRPDQGMLEKFQLGELTGFSIGGVRVEDEEISDDV
ncbi:MAG: XkdF-like putative serine protease domain-containing protein [Nitrospiraceae bacterium]